MITTSVHYPEPQKTEASLATRRAWTTSQLHSPLQRWLPNLAGRAADLDAMMLSLEEGHRPVQLATTLLLYAADQAEAERAITNAVSYWSEVRFNAPPDRYVCLPLFLQALPFNADRDSIPDLGRYRTMTTQHAARLLPVFAEWAGSGTPALTFVSRYGQLMRFDLFDSRTNFNATIAAESGSGKSFLANYLITSYLSLGAQVFVIDVGKSYQNLCELLAGSFIDVADPKVGLNPFPLVQRYETHVGAGGEIEDGEGDVLEALVGAMAAETEPLTDFQRQSFEPGHARAVGRTRPGHHDRPHRPGDDRAGGPARPGHRHPAVRVHAAEAASAATSPGPTRCASTTGWWCSSSSISSSASICSGSCCCS